MVNLDLNKIISLVMNGEENRVYKLQVWRRIRTCVYHYELIALPSKLKEHIEEDGPLLLTRDPVKVPPYCALTTLT